MRHIVTEEINRGRIRTGPLKSGDNYGFMGAFQFSMNEGPEMLVISSGPMPDWEHVSVSTKERCPTWEEMNYIKDLFWGETETVIQLHPPKSLYVNKSPFCLHLWKPVGVNIPLPPKRYV